MGFLSKFLSLELKRGLQTNDDVSNDRLVRNPCGLFRHQRPAQRLCFFQAFVVVPVRVGQQRNDPQLDLPGKLDRFA